MTATFPFSALLGQGPMKTALLMLAVDPSLGGVLIRGDKGTAKSTAARALAKLLPPIVAAADSPYHEPPVGDEPTVELATPLVELPIGATEDRLIGSLAVDAALREGKRRLEPGLLAAANRGILYVDEVNLLDDHLVDALLDVAASGVNRVEREGISHEHPARFMLVGTMNPEEGELRPQFLDRFGLCVTVDGQEEVAERCEIIRRRLAFEDAPADFAASWMKAEDFLRESIVAARASLVDVDVPEAIWTVTAELAHAAAARGHRAEIGMVKAARALSAFLGRDAVDREVLAEAARYVLPHRVPTRPLESIADVSRRIEDLIDGSIFGSAAVPDVNTSAGDEDWDQAERMQIPGAAAAGSLVLDYLVKKKRRTATSILIP
jgi:Mg-chelatase subunit ChlI